MITDNDVKAVTQGKVAVNGKQMLFYRALVVEKPKIFGTGRTVREAYANLMEWNKGIRFKLNIPFLEWTFGRY
ncbi:MAG: hypothetical protein WCX27_02340 [Candidatus Paceibacterota bacterium]